jgi:hypothetical protein
LLLCLFFGVEHYEHDNQSKREHHRHIYIYAPLTPSHSPRSKPVASS